MALEVSFRLNYRIVRSVQAQTMAINLIGPYAKYIKQDAKKIDLIPLSNNTVSHNYLAIELTDMKSEVLK